MAADSQHGMKKIHFCLVVWMGSALVIALLFLVGLFEPLERLSYDARVRLFSRETPPPSEIVLVLIDQKSLDFYEKEGNVGWPWPRDFYGVLIDALTQWGAKAIVFDLIFSEPREGDDALLEATRKSGRVFHTVIFSEKKGEPAEAETGLREFLARRRLRLESPPPGAPREYNGVTLPIPGLEEASRGVGAVNLDRSLDPDGAIRWWPPSYRCRGNFYPSLDLAVAMDILGVDRLSQSGRHELALGHSRFPLSPRSGRMAIRYFGPERTFPGYSFSHVVQDYLRSKQRLPAELGAREFRGKVVLVGTNVENIDLVKTPFPSLMPGVEYHANVLGDLLTGVSVRRAPREATVLLIVGLALLASIASFRAENLLRSMLLVALLLVAYAGAAIILYRHFSLWLDIPAPLSALLLAMVTAMVLSYAIEGKEKRFLRHAFERYLHPEIINEIVRKPGMLKLGGVRREISVLFSDLAGFTSMSERLEPETLVAVLNRYLSEMSRIIMDEVGTLDKYEGDAIMAFWGAPLPSTDHARRACRAAIACQRRLEEIRPSFEAAGVSSMQARIGINSGPAVVGNMGSEMRFDYTAMGDNVNLASRLEGVNKVYGTAILVSEATFAGAQEEIEAREIDILRVKGKKQPVRVYELLGLKGDLSESGRRVVEAYRKAMELYRARSFEAASAAFQAILERAPQDGPSRTMLGRCRLHMAAPPPADWDGAHTLETK
jgi:adenylate cyclase